LLVQENDAKPAFRGRNVDVLERHGDSSGHTERAHELDQAFGGRSVVFDDQNGVFSGDHRIDPE
jgi:hypothetical protein